MSEAEWRQHVREKLCYCREEEEAVLMDLFQKSLDKSPTLVLIQGPKGSGKTTLAKSLKSHVRNGWFLSGKSDRLQRPEPYASLMAALEELTSLILLSGSDAVQDVRERAFRNVGEEAAVVLTRMIPSLARILGSDRDEMQSLLSGRAGDAFQRFVFVLREFLLALCSPPDRPLVILLDDIHWADSSLVQLLLSLVSEAFSGNAHKGLIFLATCDERGLSSPQLSTRLDDMESKGFLNRVCLGNLDESKVGEVMSSILTDDSIAEHVAKIVFAETRGNLDTLNYMLRWLFKADLVYRNDQGMWTCEVEEVDMAVKSCHETEYLDCEVNFVMTLTEDVTEDVQSVLKVAACIGPYVDEELLMYALDSEVTSALKVAELEGLIIRDDVRQVYVFENDRIQEAVYSLIPEEGRELFHLEVGRRIWRKLDDNGVDKHLYTVLSQLRIGARLIVRPNERAAVAKLSLLAGRKAAGCSNFAIASVYFDFGIDLLEQSWKDNYDLALALHDGAAESAMCVTKFDRMQIVINAILCHARTLQDKLQAYSTLIHHLGGSGQTKQAVELSLKLLGEFGEKLPRLCLRFHLLVEMMRVRKLLKGKSDEMLLRMRVITDNDKLACLRILHLVLLHSYKSEPMLEALIILRMVVITVTLGCSAFSSFAFAAYGEFLLESCGDLEGGYRYGHLGMKFLAQYQAQEYLPSVYAIFYGFICPHKRSLKEALDPLKAAYKIGLVTGNVAAACTCGLFVVFYGNESGSPLDAVAAECRTMQGIMLAHRQGTVTVALLIEQVCHHHMGFSSDPTSSKGDLIDFDEATKAATENQEYAILQFISFCRMILCYIYNDFDAAEKYARASKVIVDASFRYEKMVRLFFSAMVAVALARDGRKVRNNIRYVRHVIRGLRHHTQQSPHNFLDKAFLLRAELESFLCHNAQAYEFYLCALALAEHADSLFMIGHVNECTARHHVRIGDYGTARSYLEAAHRAYGKWGGTVKCKQLEAEMVALGQKPEPIPKYRRISWLR